MNEITNEQIYEKLILLTDMINDLRHDLLTLKFKTRERPKNPCLSDSPNNFGEWLLEQ